MEDPADSVWLRNPAISATEIDAETFLVEPETGEVYYLDEISSALWRLLAEPCAETDIVRVYAAAFPDQPSGKIAADIRAAIDDMASRSLVVRRPSG